MKQVQSKPKVWVPVAIFAIAVVLYLNTLGHGFVFDDLTLIWQNLDVQQLKWSDILSLHGYRPIRTFTYAINHVMGGENAFGYHLVNVLLHAINAALVYALFWIWTRSNGWAGAGALIFAVHPVQTAAVAYISGRKDLLATMFVLLGCYCYTRYRQTEKRRFVALTLLFFILGVFSKEVAIVFPAMLLLIDALLVCSGRSMTGQGRSQSGRYKTREHVFGMVRRSIALFGTFFILAVAGTYYAMFMVPASRMVGLWGGSFTTHIGTCFKLFAHYVKLAVFPYPLIADYTGRVFPISAGLLEPWTLPAVVVAAGYGCLALWTFRRHPQVGFGLLWFLIALLPVLQIVPFHELAADHFLYMPMVGVAFLSGRALEHLIRVKKLDVLGWATLGAVSLIFSILAVDRNRDWKDDLTLWEATLRRAPGSYRANANLGQLYHQQLGKPDLAIQYSKRAVELDPSQAMPWLNLGSIYHDLAQQARRAGRYDQAMALAEEGIRCLQKSIALDPYDAFAYSNLASCYKELGLVWEKKGVAEKALQARTTAIEYFNQALNTGSDSEMFPAIWFSLGMVFVEAGIYDQATAYLIHATNAYPTFDAAKSWMPPSYFASIHYWTGFAYFKIGRYQDCIPYLETAAAVDPNLELWSMLAKSYDELAENGKAIETYLRALGQFPSSVEAHYNLGLLYARIGETRQAIDFLERALRLSPDGPLLAKIQGTLATVRGQSKPLSESS